MDSTLSGQHVDPEQHASIEPAGGGRPATWTDWQNVSGSQEAVGRRALKQGLWDFWNPDSEQVNNSDAADQQHTQIQRETRALCISFICILFGLALMWYILQRFYPRALDRLARCLAQDSPRSSSGGNTADAPAPMASKLHGVPQEYLDEMPVVKYRSVHCKLAETARQHKQRRDSHNGSKAAARGGGVCRYRNQVQAASADPANNAVAALQVAEAVSAETLQLEATERCNAATEMVQLTGTAVSAVQAGVADNALQEAGAAGSTSSSFFVGQHAPESVPHSVNLNHSTPFASRSAKRRTCSSSSSRSTATYGCTDGDYDSCSDSSTDECAICCEEYVADDNVKQLPCQHYYHPGCIDAWLLEHETCPLCKARVVGMRTTRVCD